MEKPSQKREPQFKSNRQLLVFVACFLLAMVIWFVNALSKQYTTTVEKPIIYKGLPASIISADLPQKLNAEITGRGFDLMQFNFRNNIHSLIIDFDKLPAAAFAGNPNAINTAQLLRLHGADTKNPITIIHVSPEIIQFHYSGIHSKKIPVKAHLNFSFKKQYAPSGPIVIQPDSIYISGDSAEIVSVREAETVPADFNLLDKTLFHSVKLKPASNKISYSADKIWVYLKVEPFTEGSVTVPISIINAGMKQITLIPDYVTVNYHVPLSLYKTIRADQFDAAARLTNTFANNKLKIKISKKPAAVTNVSFSPEEVDFFIKQK